MRFELTHRLPCLTDFKSAPLNRLGTAPEYKKATVPYKTAAFVPEDRCKSVRFKCFQKGRDYTVRPRMRFVLYECMPKDSADERSEADSIDRKDVKNILRLFHLIKDTIP